MSFQGGFHHLIRIGWLTFVVGLFAASAHAQLPNNRPSASGPPARLHYRAVPSTVRGVDTGNPRFRMAPEGYRLNRAISLISRDRAVYSIAWINGMSSGRLRDGRGFVILPHYLARESSREFRVARTIELAGGYSDRAGEINPAPASHPAISGYGFVLADSIDRRNFVGLWRRIRGAEETLIVTFRTASGTEPAGHEIIGRLPLRLTSIYLHGGLHIWYINVISEAPVGRPIYILSYELVPARTYLNPGTDPIDPPAH
jgi:hypothetical protein